jgi:hypothetical protein
MIRKPVVNLNFPTFPKISILIGSSGQNESKDAIESQTILAATGVSTSREDDEGAKVRRSARNHPLRNTWQDALGGA